WGHFSGASFAAEFAGQKDKPVVIRAVSAADQAVSEKAVERMYLNPAPAFERLQSYFVRPVSVWNPAKAADKDQDPAHDPDRVLLLDSADFSGVQVRPQPAVAPVPAAFPGAFVREFAALRAVWGEQRTLKAGARSCIFGFTSNLPPTFANTRIESFKNGDIEPAKPGEGTARGTALCADGEAPTPLCEACE